MNPHGKREAERIEPRDIERTQAETISLVRNVAVRAGWDLPFLDDAVDALRCERDDLRTKNVELHAELVTERARSAECVRDCDARVEKIDREYKDSALRYTEGYVAEIVSLRADLAGAQAAIAEHKAARAEAIAQVNKLVAEVARLTDELEDVASFDDYRGRRIDELEACLRERPDEDEDSATYKRQWNDRRDTLLAGPPANVIQTVGEIDMVEERCAADDEQCAHPRIGGAGRCCDCGVVVDLLASLRYRMDPTVVDPAPPAEADTDAEWLARLSEQAERNKESSSYNQQPDWAQVRKLLAYTKRLETLRNQLQLEQDAAIERAEAAETRAKLLSGALTILEVGHVGAGPETILERARAEAKRVAELEAESLAAESARAEEGERWGFEKELAGLLNRYCCENLSNTPDFILARMLVDMLNAAGVMVREREHWYGRPIGGGGAILTPSEGGKP